jgi:hypothetical protein
MSDLYVSSYPFKLSSGYKSSDYFDLYPDWKEYIKHDDVIGYDDNEKGNIDLCVWKRQEIPPNPPAWMIEREVMRVLRTGLYIFIADELVWIPPNYYFFLQYFPVAGGEAQFRLKRLKHCYFKIRVRNNPKAIGTYTIKNRQDGETTFAMSDCLWEVADGNMDSGNIGMQSKTRDTVESSCWRTFTMGWNAIPEWLRNAIFYDMISGDKIAEKMKFMHLANLEAGDKGRDILIKYGASVHNAFDSFNNMRRCVLDEINKWRECSFYMAFLNYKKFIAAGATRKGLFDIFSSPSDDNGKHNEEAYEFWKKSEWTEEMLLNGGTTESGIFRYYSNPLDGIEGLYDKFGDADPEVIIKWIEKERASVREDLRMAEIRAYPLNEFEMFGATDDSNIWSNADGIKKRVVYLSGRRYKVSSEKEPVRVYGNLEWKEGVLDSEVEFRQADKFHFDMKDARFSFSHLPKHKEPLRNILKPPKYVENCLGVDPFNLRDEAKHKGKQSLGAMVNHKFRDLFATGINKTPTMLYCGRPYHQDIFFEDAIKAAVFNRALVQYENRSDKLANYFEDRGYFDWLLPEIGASQTSRRKGDAPSGKGKFLEEGMGLIDAFTNVPISADDPYLLENIWFVEMLEDFLKFNPLDTHTNDISMAFMQALIGAAKIMYKKIKPRTSFIDRKILRELLGY